MFTPLSRREFLKSTAAGAMLLATGSLASCAAPLAPTAQDGAPGAAVQVVRALMWSNGPIIDDNFKKRAADFNELHKGAIEINLQLLPWDQYWSKIDLSYAARDPYDIYFWDIQAYGHYKAGLLRNLQPFVDAAPELMDPEQYPVALYDVWRFDGENLYALPENFQILAFYYNKDLLDQAGLPYPDENYTWDALIEASKQLKQGEGDQVTQWGFDLGDLHAWWGAQTLAWAMGGAFFDRIVEPTRMQMSDPPNVQALQFLQDLLWKDNLAPTFSQAEFLAPGTSLFQAGKAAMLVAGSWSLSGYKDVAFNWGIAPLPKWIDTRVPAFWFGGWVITRDSKAPEGAFEFARWSATDYQQTMAVNHDWIPLRKEARESAAMFEGMPDGFDITLASIFEARLGDVYHSRSQELLNEAIFPNLEQLWANKITAAQAAAQMDEKGNQILQKGA
ncbi:extracellular solute-binding protein [Caldilinea sp.]|uniref:extracellular solute-binding protein n=1 Tax=Caldilinea sp. TaxID=2293560 RepID=UPI0021DEA3D2|nr:extracellular solute-binding protein [Caldilinea sp.]GIV70840.1 MAG: sugar ABC transporter substrate-binding protein [Caldilinea sp.]